MAKGCAGSWRAVGMPPEWVALAQPWHAPLTSQHTQTPLSPRCSIAAKIGTCQACIFLYRSEAGEDAAALQDAVAASQPGSFGCNGSYAGHVLTAGLEKFRVQKLRRHIKSGKPCSEAVLLDIVSCERDNRGGARAGAGKRPAAAKAATKAASNKRKDDKQKLRREEEKQKKARKN